MNQNTESILQQRDYLIIVIGLCPLLAGVDTLQAGLLLGVAVLLLVMLLSVLSQVMRYLWPAEIQRAVCILMCACAVALLYMGLQIWFYEYSQSLALYLQMLAMNCIVLVSMEAASGKQHITVVMAEALLTGMLILAVIIGAGLIRQYGGLFLLKQPFGVFFILGLCMAFYRFVRERPLLSA